MDQNKPRPSNFTMIQTPTPVTCQIITSQITSVIASPSTSNYVLTSSSLRPIGNYTLVASSQVPVSHQYVVQSTTRPTMPQYVSTGNVRHILSSSSQPSNVTYMLPSGAQLVRMNNVLTTTIAGDTKSNTQFILTSSTQKINPNVVSPLGAQPSKTTIATVSESNCSNVMVSRTISVTTSTTPIFQRAGISLPRLNTAYYSQIKTSDSSKISFRPKLNEQKPGTSYILAPNDWPRTKNVPMSSLQKINTNFTQIPLIQKSGTVLSTNTIRSNVDIQQQRSQHQSIRSVILPSNYRTASVSQQQGTDCKLVLNSINVAPQVLSSNDISTSNTTVANIQQLNTNYMQIPIAQKPGTILTRGTLQPNMENNVRIGQQQQTIRSVILPSNYRAAMVSSPRRGVDYRLILKPVNIQSQVLRNLPPSRFTPPRNTSVRNTLPRQTSSPIRPTAFSSGIPMNRPSTSKFQNEVVDLSKITPISQRGRKSKLVITDRSIKICVEEINSKKSKDDEPDLVLSESAIKLMQIEVTYRLFYLLRECKKVLHKSRSNVLTEEAVRLVCSEYFTTFYGNKLWPLFCLKPDSSHEEPVWMRKHNNVNLIGWIKHPKFRDPSYIRKRRVPKKKNASFNNTNQKTYTSNIVYEVLQPSTIDELTMDLLPPSQTFVESLKPDELPSNSLAQPRENDNNNDDVLIPTPTNFVSIHQASEIPSTSKQIPTSILTSNQIVKFT